MQPEETFTLQPGDRIKRTDLHDSLGGGRQGGISPSRKSPNVFLFFDADTGLQHGYVDGWKADGLFDYTGEGQRGDQAMKMGNGAILNHRTEGRALRLFNGTGGLVLYEGEFELNTAQPYYRTDAPETNDGPTRSVLVFRLRPIDRTVSKDSPVAAPATRLVLKETPIEQQHTESFVINPSAVLTEAERREARLVVAFCAFIKQLRGHIAVRHRIVLPGEVKPLFTDVFIKELNLLIEAKGSVERGSFRTAIGQLADYRRFLNKPRCAILLPDQPRQDLLDLATLENLAVIWPLNSGFAANVSTW